MTYVAVFLLMTIVLAIVAYPLLRGEPALAGEAAPLGEPLQDLLSERDSAYAGIKELEFEHELGNLSDSDFQELRDDYRHKAARVLEQIEVKAAEEPVLAAVIAPATSAEDEIELAIQRLRERRARPVQAARLKGCPLCREEVKPADKFCLSCGADLGRFCRGCGEPREPGDRFCTACGAPMEAKS